MTLITKLGISVEGSVISERQDANTLAYQSDVSVKSLLSGIVPRPDWAQPLYQTLDTWAKSRGGQHEWIDDSPAQGQGYATPTFKTHFESDFNPQNEWFTQAYDFRSSARNWSYASRGPTMPVPFAELTSNTRGPLDSKPDGELFDEPVWIRPIITPKAGLTASLTPGEGARRAVALFDFNAIEVCDQPLIPWLLCSHDSHFSPAISRSRRERLSRSPRRLKLRIHGTQCDFSVSSPVNSLDCS